MLEDIKSNIAKLIALYEAEKQRSDVLSEQLAKSEELNLKYKEQIAELNRQIDATKLMGAFTGSGDNSLAKERINKLIREIDRCIKLLED